MQKLLIVQNLIWILEKNSQEREASDARLKVLTPTAKAAHLDAQVDEYLHQMEQCLTNGLSSVQLALFLETAAHMSANLDR